MALLYFSAIQGLASYKLMMGDKFVTPSADLITALLSVFHSRYCRCSSMMPMLLILESHTFESQEQDIFFLQLCLYQTDKGGRNDKQRKLH